jgi:hypothetical protein
MNLNAAVIKLSIWASQHSPATRLLMSALPFTLALATAVILKKPINYIHPDPACGTGTTGPC